MGTLSISPWAWFQAMPFAQDMSPINTIGLYRGQHANMPIVTQPPSLPALPDPAIIEAMSNDIIASAPHAGAVQGIWKFEGGSRPPALNDEGTKPKDKSNRTLKIRAITPETITLDDVMDGLTRQDVNDIIAHIANSNSEIGSAVRMNRELSERYVSLIWLADRYTPNRKGVEPHLAAALDVMSEELGKRLDDLCLDLMQGTALERRAAAVVAGMIPMFAYTAGDGQPIDRVTGSLVEATQKADDLFVRYDTSIALASLAKKFHGRVGMVLLGISTLLDAMEILRHDSQFAEHALVKMLKYLDGLTDQKGQLMPPLTPSSPEIGRITRMLTVLMSSGASSEVRTTAKDAFDAFQSRLRNHIVTKY